jgi:hypothetical protein
MEKFNAAALRIWKKMIGFTLRCCCGDTEEDEWVVGD